MLRLFLLFLICWCLFMSTAMIFASERVLDYVKGSRMWMWYLSKVFNITQGTLNGIAAIRWVRIQGGIALAVALLALYAWVRGT